MQSKFYWASWFFRRSNGRVKPRPGVLLDWQNSPVNTVSQTQDISRPTSSTQVAPFKHLELFTSHGLISKLWTKKQQRQWQQSKDKGNVCVKLHRPPMTNTHTLLDGTETAFRKFHASERPFACIFKKINICWVQTSVDAITSLYRPQKKHSSRSEFTPELHRSISKLTASHLQILHQEIFWSPW